MVRVIVFGPTGNIGSVAAHTARSLGAHVILAMRDTQKSIPGITAEEERAGGYERVHADLTKPETVAAAVKQSQATRAFFYLAPGLPDHMRATIEALKASGIEFAVFLSSYTIDRDVREVEPKDLISFIHAQVEMVLDDVYGPENYVAIRPGGFATNLLRYKRGIAEGEVRILGSAMQMDCITPGDMGRASGEILVNGPKNGQQKVYLYGPRVITQADAVKLVGEVLGKDITVSEGAEDETRRDFESAHLPPPVIEYMMRVLVEIRDGAPQPRTKYDEGLHNVQLYTGQPATRLKEWLATNRVLFEGSA